MEKPLKLTGRHRVPVWLLFLVFLAVTVIAFFALSGLHRPEGNTLQQGLYVVGGAVLLGGVGAFAAAAWYGTGFGVLSRWTCPLAAAGISLLLFMLAYIFLGVWPVGYKTVMLVDMHHQYAPLLSELRALLLGGGDFTYSFHIGLGSNFIPAFAYYLASPLNLLLLLFPERLLAEGVLLITLLKGAAAAAAFAACAQYLTRRRSSGVVALGVLYSLSGYMLAYSWNIMWLDGVILLPVVVLCMERMLRTGKVAAYAATLALALFANYYIGFMLCVFLVLYMAVWLLRQPRAPREWLTGCGRFAAGSLLAGGLAAALLVPTALALGRTSAAGETLGAFDSNFPLFDLLGRLLYGATPTIRSGNLPNLYCGLPAVLLMPIYLTRKQLPLRRRLCYGGLLLVLLVSCTVTQLDLLWHGLHTPNDLPYRFSFLVGFVLLLMAAQVLARPEHITSRQVLGSLSGCAIYLLLWEKLDAETAPTPAVLYMNLALLAIYGAVLMLGALRRAPQRMVVRLLLAVVCVELLIGSSDTLLQMNEDEHYTEHSDYLDNEDTAADDAAIRRVEELARQELGDTFYRLEYLPRSTCMDTARHHYSGLTTFASSNPYQATLLMGDLGYAFNGVNSYLYHSFVAATDSLFGIRYVVLEANIRSHPQLEQIDHVTVGEETRYIYRNRLALPLGYMVDNDIREYASVDYAPFTNHERLYAAMVGEWVELYEPVELYAKNDLATVNGDSSIQVEGDDMEAEFAAVIEEEGQYFAYVDCRAAEDITVLSYDEDGQPENTWGVTTYEPYIIDMGTLSVGQTVETWITSDSSATGNIYIVRLNAEEMERQLTALQAGGLTVTAQSHSHLEGTVTAAETGTMLLSIPYDTGWTVLVDGKPAKTFPLASTERDASFDAEKDTPDGALLCVEVSAGTHTVTLTYRAPGQILGLIISLVCLAILAAWLILPPVLQHRRASKAAIPAQPDAVSAPEEAADVVEDELPPPVEG